MSAEAKKPDDEFPAAQSTYALLRRHRAGDKVALQVLMERYYPRVRRIVRVRLGAALLQRETIDDVVQDVFVRIVEGLIQYEERVDARWIDWVAQLAQNEIANHARRDGTRKRGGDLAARVRSLAESAASFAAAADSTAVHSKVATREAEAIVDQCLHELSEPHREVILLRDYADCDWKTVAEQMGRSTAEACQELHRRALQELRRRYRGRL